MPASRRYSLPMNSHHAAGSPACRPPSSSPLRRSRAEMRPLLMALAIAGAGTATLDAADPGAWTPLFNGRDLRGWTVKCKPADRDRTWWKVEDGAIVADSMNGGAHDYIWLVSDRAYTNFILRLKFQAFRDNPGNSGVQIRSRYDDDAGWLDGPQVDIHPPAPWRTGMVWDETRGNQRWLWPAVAKGAWVNESMANPVARFYYADQTPAWNDLEITAAGLRLKAVLNGVSVMECDGKGVLDDAVHRERRVGEAGHIALQIHTGDRLRIRFKDLELRELPAS